MRTLVITALYVCAIALAFALAVSMTLTEEEAQAELDEYVARRLEDE